MRLLTQITATLSLLFCSSLALAQARVLEVEVVSPLQAAKAYGLLFSSSMKPKRIEAELSKSLPDTYLVRFPVSLGDEEQFASAVIIDPQGERAFGRTVRVRSQHRNIASLPACQPESNLRPKDKQNYGLIEELVRIRYKRRDSYHQQIKDILTPEFLDRINSLEEKFGLNGTSDISPSETSPLELIERISRLVHAVERYKQKSSPSEEISS